MSQQTRRSFLKRTAAAGVGATFTISGTKASGRVIGANDTIRMGVAGIHGRGQSHISAYLGMDKVQVTHLIDPDSRLFKSRTEKVKKANYDLDEEMTRPYFEVNAVREGMFDVAEKLWGLKFTPALTTVFDIQPKPGIQCPRSYQMLVPP